MSNVTVKLNIVNNQLRDSFIDHLNTIQMKGCDVVFFQTGSAVVLEYTWESMREVYYKTWEDFACNKPLLSLDPKGEEVEQQTLNGGDRLELEMIKLKQLNS